MTVRNCLLLFATSVNKNSQTRSACGIHYFVLRLFFHFFFLWGGGGGGVGVFYAVYSVLITHSSIQDLHLKGLFPLFGFFVLCVVVVFVSIFSK